MSKIIKFQGQEYKVPDWANWLATDYDTSTWIFRDKPDIRNEEQNIEWRLPYVPGGTNYSLLCKDSARCCENWQDTLTPISDLLV